MLENMRRQGASIFVYLIFCLLIAIFIINFRPGQGRGESGCSTSSNLVVSVDGTEASQTAFRIAYANSGGQGAAKKANALEMLIRRELLVKEGKAHHLNVTNDLVEKEITNGYFFLNGERKFLQGLFDEDGKWSLPAFNRWVQNLGVSRNSYEGEQTRSMEATLMAELLQSSVQVSREEAKQHWLYDHTLVKYDYVKFKAEDFRSALHVTDADVDRYLAAHADAVQKQYKADERLYKGAKEVKLREIFIAKSEVKQPQENRPDAKDKQQGSAAGAGAGSASATGSEDPKAKLEAMRATIASGKLAFADAAKELASEPELKAKGGDLGWQPINTLSLGDKAVNDAAKSLKKGEMTPVIATDKGAYLLLAEDRREGDLTFDQVKHEIAEKLARKDWGQEAAKRAALKALADADGKALDTLYPHGQPSGYKPPVELRKEMKTLAEMVRNKDLSDQQKSVFYQGWGQDQQMLMMNRTMVLGAAAAAAKTDVTPTKDELPKVDVPLEVTREGPAPRMYVMPGIERSKEISNALFDELGKNQLAKKIYQVGENYFVVQLVDKETPDIKDFDKEASEVTAELRQTRAAEALESWLRTRCDTLAKENKIKVNPDLVLETDDKGNVLPTQYHPCKSFHSNFSIE
jgi:parvulin-like peptidyl-prolyl isomerase